MNDELKAGVPLTREALFRMIVDEACRDGVIEPFEKAILENMARFLRLERDEALRIALSARDRFKNGALGEQRPLDPLKIYSMALKLARSDGRIDKLEEQMLAGLRKLFHLSDEDHASICIDLEIENEPSPTGPTESGTPSGPRVPIPPPGSTTDILGRRLEQDALNAWVEDHRYWFNLPRHASQPAQKAWEGFLRGMANGNEGDMYDGLDALDDVLNSLEGVKIADILLALAVLRWSRVLLKTTFPAMESDEARFWPGQELYLRLCVKMGPILISIDHLRNKTGIEEGLAMTFVYLCEDLCLLLRRRHAEPVRLLGDLIPQVAKILPKQLVTHQAATLIESWSEMVARRGGALAEAFVAVCREICRTMPQNHPLALAAHTALESLAPAQTVFPRGYQPRMGGSSTTPSSPGATQRLERLLAETARENEEERLLAQALVTVNLGPVDDILAAATASYREHKMDPKLFLFRNLVVMIFPTLPEFSRPVVAFFALGNPEGHHEEMKGGWVPLLLKRLDDNSVQVIPDFLVFPSTALLSIPLNETEATALQDALDRSGGAYDVVLVDPGRKGARIWHQTGDLDPTGNLFQVEKSLLPAEKIPEAQSCLDRALSRHPWLSRALLQKGLIAKRAGDLQTARQFFERAREVQPHDPHALTRIGVLDKGENRMDSSEKALLQALRILPTEPSAVVTLASMALGRVAGGETTALPLWDYYVAGLHAIQGAGPDFVEIATVGDSLDPALSLISRITPVDSVFYL
jgi:hypothetical protein